MSFSRVALFVLPMMTLQSAAADFTLSLKDEALVSTHKIRLADVALVGAETHLGDVEIAAAPRGGVATYLRRADVERVLRAHAGVNAALHWSGAEVVAIRSSTQTIDGKTLVEAASNYLQRRLRERFPDATVRAAAPVADVEVRQGPISLSARGLTLTALRARESVWIDIVGEAGVERSVVIPLQVVVRVKGFVATHDLAAGRVLVEADIHPSEIDLATSGDALQSETYVIGGRTRQAIKAGEVLGTHALADRRGVLRGDAVQVNVVAGAVHVDASGIAQSDAAFAEPVRVRMMNGTIVDARVVGDRTVAIE